MLGCYIECVAQIHPEGDDAPAEAVLNVRVSELGRVEEVSGHDVDRMARPRKQVLVASRYIKDLVGYLAEEGCHLRSCD